jgi:hypothetical protein
VRQDDEQHVGKQMQGQPGPLFIFGIVAAVVAQRLQLKVLFVVHVDQRDGLKKNQNN